MTQKLRDALEAASNGLKWYRDEYPLAESGADDEMMTEIEAALAEPTVARVIGEIKHHRGHPFACLLTAFDENGDGWKEGTKFYAEPVPAPWMEKEAKYEAEMRTEYEAHKEKAVTYSSTQATNCAGCGERKHTPLRIDTMGGYVCLTCIDQKLGSLLGEFGYQEGAKAVAPSPQQIAQLASDLHGLEESEIETRLLSVFSVLHAAMEKNNG